MADEKDFFEANGLKIDFSNDIKIGETYPIYGIITDIVSETPKFVVKINYNITAEILLQGNDTEKIKIIKDRSFEPGIFITTIEQIVDNENEYNIIGTVKTAIFGKKQHKEFDA